MVFIPLSDEAPTRRHEPPYVTYAIIAICVVAFLWRQSVSAGEDIVFARHFGVTPNIVFGDSATPLERILPFFTYTFLHGGWAHIFGNMLFLWIFGDDIEDALGHVRYAIFYVATGVAGALLYCAFATVPTAPLVGASGAIAGVMGAYLMIRPCAQVRVLVFIKIVSIRAMWLILIWSALQVWHVMSPTAGNVAWWAHIGGLIAGAALIAPMKRPDVKLFECVDTTKFVSPWHPNRGA